MSLVGKMLRNTGLYNILESHFFDRLLIPFATQGQINIREARFLGKIVRDLVSSGPIVEIGTLFGRSARVLAENAKENQKIITVDRFSWNPLGLSSQQHKRLTQTMLMDAVLDMRIEIVESDKRDFFRQWSGAKPALVFIDADHSYDATKEDIEWALSVGTEVVCGHDYSEDCPGVIKAVESSGGIKEIVDRLWILNNNDRRKG